MLAKRGVWLEMCRPGTIPMNLQSLNLTPFLLLGLKSQARLRTGSKEKARLELDLVG